MSQKSILKEILSLFQRYVQRFVYIQIFARYDETSKEPNDRILAIALVRKVTSKVND